MNARESGVQIQLYSFFNLGTRWRWVVKATPLPLYPTGKRAVPIVEEATVLVYSQADKHISMQILCIEC
jgi:hypothetical protein